MMLLLSTCVEVVVVVGFMGALIYATPAVAASCAAGKLSCQMIMLGTAAL